jgi:hypothetical protein
VCLKAYKAAFGRQSTAQNYNIESHADFAVAKTKIADLERIRRFCRVSTNFDSHTSVTTNFRSFETKDSVLSLFEKTQRVFDVQKDSQFIEPRAKTNENPISSETLSCFCCKLIQFDKLCDFLKS